MTGSWGPQRNFSSPEMLYKEQICSWRWSSKHPAERKAGSPSRAFHFVGPEGKITFPAGIYISLPAQIPLFLAGLTPCKVPAAHSAPGALPQLAEQSSPRDTDGKSFCTLQEQGLQGSMQDIGIIHFWGGFWKELEMRSLSWF